MNSPTYYDSMESAASMMKIELATLKRAKRKGADGFKGSRVYPKELLAWLQKNKAKMEGKGETKDELLCQKLRVQIERMQYDFDVAKGDYIASADVDQWQTERAESLKRLLTGKIINELLPKLVGLNVPEMVPIARGYVSAIVADFRKPMADK